MNALPRLFVKMISRGDFETSNPFLAFKYQKSGRCSTRKNDCFGKLDPYNIQGLKENQFSFA